ncbi:hypothetical protein E2C01_012417 [Portunus trituberculatus]|uniref:Uncharacterized protein n=1 Tax=Portunus trituberculatus TaxID=210409 RepID=A0A5B7DDL2_PORTR|nr:hypothetical protein [Portunus trituberculatus]
MYALWKEQEFEVWRGWRGQGDPHIQHSHTPRPSCLPTLATHVDVNTTGPRTPAPPTPSPNHHHSTDATGASGNVVMMVMTK